MVTSFNFLFLFQLCVQLVQSARILFILPLPLYSHYVVGGVLSKAMAAKGHNVTVIGPFPPDTEIKNYRYIYLDGVHQAMKDVYLDLKINIFEFNSASLMTKITLPNEMGYRSTRVTYNNGEVQELLKSDEGFDVVVYELFNTEALHGFCHHFKAPCVALTTSGTNLWSNRLTGNVGMSSYVADTITDNPPEMNFFERTLNLVSYTMQQILFHVHDLPRMDRMVRQYLPKTPHLGDLMHNISIVLLNSHPALSAPVPLTPNMIEIGGAHIEGLADLKLSADVQQFLDEHEEGVIYFALGSSIRPEQMPKEKLRAILTALKRWGKPILWKFGGELPEKFDNVKVAKWFPQTAVLAHKNVKAFITHSGRLSTMEALYYGVPMVAVSIAAEQAHNAVEMVHLGYAVWLRFGALTADNFYNALVEIMSNSKYAEEIKFRSRAMRKLKAIEKAIYWIEYAIEFEGAPHLRNDGVKLPWYQFWMVDVLVVLILSFIAVSVTIVYLVLICVKRNQNYQKMKLN